MNKYFIYTADERTSFVEADNYKVSAEGIEFTRNDEQVRFYKRDFVYEIGLVEEVEISGDNRPVTQINGPVVIDGELIVRGNISAEEDIMAMVDGEHLMKRIQRRNDLQIR